MLFVRRSIDVTFIGKETVKLTDHRVTVRIATNGDPNIGSAQLQIYGLTTDRINQLATFAQAFMTPDYNYKIQVDAGDEVNGMNMVFFGNITQAWADFQGMPDIPFHVLAYATPTVQASPSGQNWNSYSGPTDVAKMLQPLAGMMGLSLENSGVNVKLTNPYHFGSPFRQAQLIREAADINMVFENKIMAIWPRNKPRDGQGPLISEQTGMVADPSFTDYGVIVRQEFSTPVKYGVNMTIKSQIEKANGPWSIKQIDYNLAANMPNGPWFVTLSGSKPDQLIQQPLQL